MKSSTAEEKLKEAHRIVGILARGLDPANDSASASDDVLNRPDVIRALLLAADALLAACGPTMNGHDDRVGEPWSEAEEDRLRRSISRRETLRNVAAGHGRSTGAITSRLVHMGLAEDPAAARAMFGMRYD